MQLNVFLLYMLIVECRNLIVEPGPAAFYPAGFQAEAMMPIPNRAIPAPNQSSEESLMPSTTRSQSSAVAT